MRAAYLLGFRGVGKTTLGRALEKQEGWHFLDLDEVWEKEQGTSIVKFVGQHGLEKFRALEFSLLQETEAKIQKGDFREPLLVATGGGLVEYAPSRELLEKSMLPKIFLEASVEVIWQRLKNTPERLLVGNLKSEADVRALYQKRQPYYEALATLRVQSTNGPAPLKGALKKIWKI